MAAWLAGSVVASRLIVVGKLFYGERACCGERAFCDEQAFCGERACPALGRVAAPHKATAIILPA